MSTISFPWVILTISASTNDDRLVAFDPILAIRADSIHGVLASRGIEAVPKHASIYL